MFRYREFNENSWHIGHCALRLLLALHVHRMKSVLIMCTFFWIVIVVIIIRCTNNIDHATVLFPGLEPGWLRLLLLMELERLSFFVLRENSLSFTFMIYLFFSFSFSFSFFTSFYCCCHCLQCLFLVVVCCCFCCCYHCSCIPSIVCSRCFSCCCRSPSHFWIWIHYYDYHLMRKWQ